MSSPEVRRPTLVVVTGAPGAGKTTLAHPLAEAIRCPLVSRDAIKEGLVNAAGTMDEEQDRTTYRTFGEVIGLLLDRGVTLVAEAAFQHRLWAPLLEPFLPRADVRLIVCAVPLEVALRRREERLAEDPARAGFHHEGAAVLAATSAYDPPRLDLPTLTVDTSIGYQPAFEAILAFATAEG